eukprot:scaffold8562_cov102-Skeletonema_dohrnii-CCMP3373.AAC.8
MEIMRSTSGLEVLVLASGSFVFRGWRNPGRRQVFLNRSRGTLVELSRESSYVDRGCYCVAFHLRDYLLNIMLLAAFRVDEARRSQRCKPQTSTK